MNKFTLKELEKMYDNLYKTVKRHSILPKPEFENRIKYERRFPKRHVTDDKLFELVLMVPFYSGFNSDIVKQKKKAIIKLFGDYRRTKEYTIDDIEGFLENKDIISHPGKILCTVLNAKIFNKIVNDHGSFNRYLDRFDYKKDDDDLMELYDDLKVKFKFFGSITTYHFLKDIGANVVKPDRQITALFQDIGLIGRKKWDEKKIIEIAKKMSGNKIEEMRVVDMILISMRKGSNLGVQETICRKKCEKCYINKICKYYLKKRNKKR